jgi:hypothetical protein
MDEFNATAADSAVLVIDVRQVIEDLQIDEAGYLELVGVFLDELGHLLDRGRLHLALDAGDIEPVVARTGPVDVTPVVRKIDALIAADPVGAATLRALKEGREPALPRRPATQAEQQQLIAGPAADRTAG